MTKNPLPYSYKKVAIILYSCLCFQSYTTAQTPTPQTTKNISFHQIAIPGYKNIEHPSTFKHSTKIYSQPDTSSNILDTAPFNKNLIILREGEEVTEVKTDKINETTGEHYWTTKITVQNWYEISFHDNLAYVKTSEIASHKFTDEKSGFEYFVITSENPRILKYDSYKKQFTDSLKLESRGDIVQLIRTDGWKNTNMLFRIQTIDAYCGGGTYDHFIIDANGKLSELIATETVGDDGSADSYSSSVWLPIKVGAGKVALLPNGDDTNIADPNSATLIASPNPKGFSVPANELIVFKEIEVKSIRDQSGEPVLNKDGSFNSKEVKNSTTYFRWNGNKLVPVKSGK